MENLISKSVEYIYSAQNKEYTVKALIVSAPEELEINNVDKEDNEGFIFTIFASTQPELPIDIFDAAKNLIFIIGNGGDNRIGILEDNTFVEIKENAFIRVLKVNVLEVLLIEGNSGHFKS